MITINCQTGLSIQVDADQLRGADLSGLNLHRAILEEQDLSLARFADTDLRGALMDKSVLHRADFRRARMMTASLKAADLENASLVDAMLNAADLTGANLRGADLSGADVGLASLKRADLRGADMNCLRLSEADLQGAIADENTRFPAGFRLRD